MLLLNFDFDSKQWEQCAIPEVGIALGDGAARIIHLPNGAAALLSGGGVFVNGQSPMPLAVLVDRDEIRAGSRIYRFSADTPADAFDFAGGRSVQCARCHGALAEGDRVVRCPSHGCRAYSHEACWQWETSPGCQKCGRSA